MSRSWEILWPFLRMKKSKKRLVNERKDSKNTHFSSDVFYKSIDSNENSIFSISTKSLSMKGRVLSLYYAHFFVAEEVDP